MRLSVIIPVFNRIGMLKETLESLVNQTVQADEIIVVDDGSTDGSGEMAAAFHPSVKVFRQSNRGPAAARNLGFSKSRGQYIHFFDSDDIAVLNKHEEQLRALEQSGSDIAVSPWWKGLIKERVFQPFELPLQQRGLPRGNLGKRLINDWALVPHACLFRRSIVERVGGFCEECFGTEDTLFLLECLRLGASLKHVPRTMELYRLGNLKITSDGAGDQRHRLEWLRLLGRILEGERFRCFRPAKSLGFRYRAYRARQSVDLVDQGYGDLERKIGTATGSLPEDFYNCYGYVMRVRAGMRYRLLGSHAGPSFRAAPATKEQLGLIRATGYEVRSNN